MSTLYFNLQRDWSKNFLLNAAAAIIVSTCLGSIAVYSIFHHGNSFLQMAQVFVVVAMCTNVLAAILTVQKPKIVFDAFVVSVICSVILTTLNLLF